MKKKKKKKLMALAASCFLAYGLSLAQTIDPPEEECTPSIDDDNGPIIVVTVCDRETSFFDALVGAECASESTESCSFTNI